MNAELTPPAADYVAKLESALKEAMADTSGWFFNARAALAARPASPDTRVTPQEAAQVLLEWWNQDTPDVGQIAIEARKVIAVTTALKDHESQPFEQVNAMLKAIIAGGQDRG